MYEGSRYGEYQNPTERADEKHRCHEAGFSDRKSRAVTIIREYYLTVNPAEGENTAYMYE